MDFWDIFDTYARHRDLKELRASQKHLRRKSYLRRKEQAQIDQTQDARIATLEHENDDLKLCLGALISVLQHRGHLAEPEAMEIIQSLIEPLVEDDG